MPTTIAQVSDLHIGAAGDWRPSVVKMLTSRADFFAISGDIVEGVDWQAELEGARELAAMLPLERTQVVLGNHDAAHKGILHTGASRKFARKVLALFGASEAVQCHHVGHVRIVGIDTTGRAVEREGPFDLARGGLWARDWPVLTDALEHPHAIVHGHHAPRYDRWSNRMVDHERFERLLVEKGALGYLCGHKHQRGTTALGGRTRIERASNRAPLLHTFYEDGSWSTEAL